MLLVTSLMLTSALAQAEELEKILLNRAVLVCDEDGCLEAIPSDADQKSPDTKLGIESEPIEIDQLEEVAFPPALPVPAIEQIPITEQLRIANEDIQEQRAMARWAFWMFLATCAGVALIAWTLRESMKTVRIARDTLEESKRTTDAATISVEETRRIGEAQVRAYLSISNFKIGKNGLSNQLSVRVTCRNSGQSPADSVVVSIMGHIIYVESVERVPFECVVSLARIASNTEEYNELQNQETKIEPNRDFSIVVSAAAFGIDVFQKEISARFDGSAALYEQYGTQDRVITARRISRLALRASGIDIEQHRENLERRNLADITNR